MPTVVVVGNSDSGKTRVASSLVATLADQGYSVATITHCPHGRQVDRPNSDRDRLSKAAAAVIASSPGKFTKVTRVEGGLSPWAVEPLLFSRIASSALDGIIRGMWRVSKAFAMTPMRFAGNRPLVESITPSTEVSV